MKRKKKKTRKTKKKRKYASSWHRHQAELAARRKRADIRNHGSVRKAQQARRKQRAQENDRDSRDRAEWTAAFLRRHGRAPQLMDEFDYTYTWRDRYTNARTSSTTSETVRARKRSRCYAS